MTENGTGVDLGGCKNDKNIPESDTAKMTLKASPRVSMEKVGGHCLLEWKSSTVMCSHSSSAQKHEKCHHASLVQGY